MPHPVGFLLRAASHIPAKARSGLYAGKTIDIANRVSRDYEVRSRRLRKPNVAKKRLYSQALGCKVQLNVTTTALRAIDRAGGLDRYLLKTPDSLLYSDVGSDLKFRIGLIYRHKLYEQQQQQQQQGKQLQAQQQQGKKLQAQQLLLLPHAADAAALAGASRKISRSLLPPAAAAALKRAAKQ